MKHTCYKCHKIAIWRYQPTNEIKEDHRYFCDDHIKRGCSCNIDPENGIEDTDNLGRLFPCCEYLYDDRGFDLC
jgi:hypothetical protein